MSGLLVPYGKDIVNVVFPNRRLRNGFAYNCCFNMSHENTGKSNCCLCAPRSTMAL